jgi:hypothetical protein
MNSAISFLPEVEDEVVLVFNEIAIVSYSMVPDLEEDMKDVEVEIFCEVIDIDGVASPHVGINNEPPGEPDQKTVTLVDQEPVSFSIGLFPVDSFFDIADAVELRIRADLNGDDVLETLAMTTLLNSAPTPSLEIEPLQDSVVQASPGKEITLSYAVTNPGNTFVWDSIADILRDDGSDGGPVGGIDGLTPGDPSPRSIALGKGETVVVTYGFIPVKSFFDIEYKVGLHIRSDFDGDGVFETLASTELVKSTSSPIIEWENWHGESVSAQPRENVTLSFTLTNNGSFFSGPVVFREHTNAGVFTAEFFRIDGMEPGVASQRDVSLASGESIDLTVSMIIVDSFFDIDYRVELRAETDLDGDGLADVLGTTLVLPDFDVSFEPAEGQEDGVQIARGEVSEVTYRIIDGFGVDSFFDILATIEPDDNTIANAKGIINIEDLDDYFRIDGLPAGTPSTGSASVPAGDSLELSFSLIAVDSFFDIELPPPSRFVVRGDLDGDGAAEVLISTSIQASARPPEFRRGDMNLSGVVDTTDAINILVYLFLGGLSLECEDAADADDDGDVTLNDAINILRFLFLGDSPPPALGHLDPGLDPTDDSLGCETGV